MWYNKEIYSTVQSFSNNHLEILNMVWFVWLIWMWVPQVLLCCSIRFDGGENIMYICVRKRCSGISWYLYLYIWLYQLLNYMHSYNYKDCICYKGESVFSVLLALASFPGSPFCMHIILRMTFDPPERNGGESLVQNVTGMTSIMVERR